MCKIYLDITCWKHLAMERSDTESIIYHIDVQGFWSAIYLEKTQVKNCCSPWLKPHLLSSSLDYEHPISSSWLLCHLPFAPPYDILSSKLFQIYTSFALGALPIYRREQVSRLFKSVHDRLYSVCWNLAIGKPSLRTFMLPPITLLIKGKYKKERNCST